MTTTQQQIDGLIASIWNAQTDRSVTNIMVARVLDWLNVRASALQTLIEQGETDRKKELEGVNRRINSLNDILKGVNSAIDSLMAGRLPSEGGDGGAGGSVTASEHVDRGLWEAGERYYAGDINEATGMAETSHVWYKGCRYRCLATGTASAPIWNSPDWMFEEGDPEAHIVFAGDADPLIAMGETKSLECRVMIYNQDATADVTKWEIERDTGSETEDTAWGMKDKARDFDGDIDLVYSQAENDLGYGGKAAFRVSATLAPDKTAVGVIEI